MEDRLIVAILTPIDEFKVRLHARYVDVWWKPKGATTFVGQNNTAREEIVKKVFEEVFFHRKK